MPTMEEVVQSLNYYFENAKPDDEYNKNLAKNKLSNIGDEMIFMGPAWIVNKIMNLGKESLRLPPDQWDKADNVIRRSMTYLVSCYQSLVLAYNEISIPGGRASNVIRAGLDTATDEDTVAIYAFILSSNELVDQKNLGHINNASARCSGSSCKILLALALKAHGDPETWKKITRDLVDEVIHNHMGQLTYEMKGPQIALEILATDIASDGKEYKTRTSKWTRKKYSD